MKPHLLKCVLFLLLSLSSIAPLANASQPFYPGFPGIKESKAYEKLKKRPVSNLSIIFYLIDRYAKADVKIVYEELRVEAPVAANVARLFLMNQYRQETPEEWILKWCNTSVFSGKAIWVEMRDGSHRLSREVLQDELDALSIYLAMDNIDWPPSKKA